MIVLIQGVGFQGAVVVTLDVWRQFTNDIRTIRSLPTFQKITYIVRLNFYALNSVRLKPFEK